MNKALENLMTRRSIRKYKAQQITQEELGAVLQAGVCAASAKNLQSATIVVVQDKETIAYMSRLNAEIGAER